MENKAPDRKELVNNLGYVIHTAMRKCCDTKTTSVAYNLVKELDREWTLFLNRLLDLLFTTEPIDGLEYTPSIRKGAYVQYPFPEEGECPDFRKDPAGYDAWIEAEGEITAKRMKFLSRAFKELFRYRSSWWPCCPRGAERPPADSIRSAFWRGYEGPREKPSEGLYSVLCDLFSMFTDEEWAAALSFVDRDFIKGMTG